MNGAEFCKKAMHDAGVAIVPGTAFGKICSDYVRFSFACSQQIFLMHCKNLKKKCCLNRLYFLLKL
jgi:aspartate/methionine/tyrosine aminotransferase